MARRPARLARAAALLVVPLLALTACGGSGGGEGLSASASASSSSTSAAPETTSSSPEPSQESSSPEETATPAEIVLADIPGYSYEDAPPDFAEAEDGMMSSGTASAVASRSVLDGDRNLAAVLLAAQYKPELVENFGPNAAESVLAGAAASSKAGLPGDPEEASVTVDGTLLKVLSTDELTVAITYFEGGLLVQFYGPVRADVVAASKAFITAQNAL